MNKPKLLVAIILVLGGSASGQDVGPIAETESARIDPSQSQSQPRRADQAPFSRERVIPPIQSDPPGSAAPVRPIPPALSNATRLATAQNIGSSSGFFSLASIPYMVGDTSGGACGTLQLQGATAVTLAHPTYGCSRLNIAENNSPVAADRMYLSYRHFHNASDVDIFSFAPTGGRNSLEIDSFTLGIERKLTTNSSLELRLPILQQLASGLTISQSTGPASSLPLNDTEIAIGNAGAILKLVLFHSERWYWSGGLAANIPTASDVTVVTNINDAQFQIFDPATGVPVGTPFPFQFNMTATRTNDTVNLSPFLASIYQLNDSVYTIGFLQLDVPLNPSTITTSGGAAVAGTPVSQFNVVDKIDQQLLMRVNMGIGERLWQDYSGHRWLNSFGVLAELHYVTTLNDADTVGPIAVTPDFGTGVPLLTFGNASNRNDVLNGVLGVQARIGKTIVTHGFGAPLRSGADRGFDFEYNFSINRMF